jgi:Uma2 family endonuclease
MTAATATFPTAQPPADPQHPEMITLEDVSWELYERLLDETQEQHLRITYDSGRMVIMSPLPRHDKVKKLVGRMIEMASFELDIPISSFGSTTWKRKDIAKGLEADECYFVKNEPLVRGRTDIDLKNDPPPDLAVEVDITHHPIRRSSVYAALGVSEIWRYDGHRIEFLRRTGKEYAQIPQSDAFPKIRPDDITRFLAMFVGSEENAVMRHFRDWIRTLV